MAGPVTGLSVLDLIRVMAGTWCTPVLVDMGAGLSRLLDKSPEAVDELPRPGIM